MSYYHTCPYCGSNLDPGETCDCQHKEEAPTGAANTGEGKAEQNLSPVSASYDTREPGDLQVRNCEIECINRYLGYFNNEMVHDVYTLVFHMFAHTKEKEVAK